jgi:hypothetical protein
MGLRGSLARNSHTIYATGRRFVKWFVDVLRTSVGVASGGRVVVGIIIMCCGRSKEKEIQWACG